MSFHEIPCSFFVFSGCGDVCDVVINILLCADKIHDMKSRIGLKQFLRPNETLGVYPSSDADQSIAFGNNLVCLVAGDSPEDENQR